MKLSLSRLFALILVVAATSVAGFSQAHSKKSVAMPEDGDLVEIGHNSFAIMFNRKVRFTKVSLHRSVQGKTLAEMVDWDEAAGHLEEQHIESKVISDLPRGFVTDGTFEFDPLDEGVYHIQWIVVANDGHVMEGAEHFEVLAETN